MYASGKYPVQVLYQKVDFIFNDSHYYFSDEDKILFQDFSESYDGQCHVIGNQYSVQNGTYMFPLHEGKFTVQYEENKV